MLRLRQAADALLDLVYPPRCTHCGRIDTPWCARCLSLLNDHPIQARRRVLSPALTVYITGVHDDLLRDAVHALKYNRAHSVAAPLAARAAAVMQRAHVPFDILIPVPLAQSRLRERGYNQSQVIGSHMAKIMHTPLVVSSLQRTRSTASQVGLSVVQRRENVHDAFRADSQSLDGRIVLLLDDVLTSGATMQACAAALYQAGARQVIGVAITGAQQTQY
jgi:ComF family protein